MKIKNKIILLFLFFTSFGMLAKDYKASLFGIHSDGKTLNTTSIQFAVNYISANGGGRLVFYVGRYLTGTINLKSNVTIHLEEGAVLVGSTNPFDYEKTTASWCYALLVAYDQENIGISGKGIIDGQGAEVARNVVNNIEKGLTKDAYKYGRPSEGNRPMLVYFKRCKEVKITEITYKNSASWNQTYDMCKNLVIDGITVDNTTYWNQDGIDIVDCDTVSITNCYIDAADDGICLKSHDATSFCNNIFISKNKIRTSANGIKFGTASKGGFKNIKIVNNIVFDTYRSAIALESVDGGFLENIEIDSLQVFNTGNLIYLTAGE
jgi:polygalacturonase